MRIVGIADSHLGFSRYSRTTPEGRNQREADVARQFEHAINKTIELAPDAVIFCGDIFHQSRPANPVIVHAFQQFQRLAQAIDPRRIVVLAGNHDLPRTNDMCILRLLDRLDIQVVDRAPRGIAFPEISLGVTCIPEVRELEETPAPQSFFRYNVLAIHGEVRGLIKGSRAPMMYDANELEAGGWDLVLLGHFHDHTEVAPRVFYCGATDYTTSNAWEEAAVKGIIEYDLDAHLETFHPLPNPRPHRTLEIGGAGASVEDLNVLIKRQVEFMDPDDNVIRVVLNGVDRATLRQIDPRMIREFKARAVHFAIEARPPESARELIVGMVPRATSLETELRAKLETIQLNDTIDRAQFVERGLKYFERTTSEAA